MTKNESIQENETNDKADVVSADNSVKMPLKYTDNMIIRECDNKIWYILRAFIGQEQRAVNELIRRLDMFNLTDKLVELFTPKEQLVVLDGNVKKHKEESFYPGFVFVAFDIATDKEIHDVASLFMRVHHKLSEVSAEEIARMKDLYNKSLEAPTTATNIKEGQYIRVISGSYKDMTGHIYKMDFENKKVYVKLNIFDREVEVMFDIDQVKGE